MPPSRGRAGAGVLAAGLKPDAEQEPFDLRAGAVVLPAAPGFYHDAAQ